MHIAVKVLYSICQQIWKTPQGPQDWKRSVFIPIPKKGNAEEKFKLLHNCTHFTCWQSNAQNYHILPHISQHLAHRKAQLFVTPWTAVLQASLSSTVSQSLLKFMSIESVMPSNHLILCCPSILLLPSIFPSIRVFSIELAFHSRGLKYWSFSFNISPSSEYSGLIFFKVD